MILKMKTCIFFFLLAMTLLGCRKVNNHPETLVLLAAGDSLFIQKESRFVDFPSDPIVAKMDQIKSARVLLRGGAPISSLRKALEKISEMTYVQKVEVIDEGGGGRADIDFALNDNNVSHWQYAVSFKAPAGFDEKHNVAYFRVKFKDGKVWSGEGPLERQYFMDKLNNLRSDHDRVAVGILVSEASEAKELLPWLKIIEMTNCKAAILYED